MDKAGLIKYITLSAAVFFCLSGIAGAMGSGPDLSGSITELFPENYEEPSAAIPSYEDNFPSASDTVLISEEKSEKSALKNSNTSINFFYSERCGACHKVLPIVKEISAKYPNIPVYYYDTYNSPKNRSVMYTFAEYYGVDYPAYPNLFAGDSIYLEGFTEIKNNIEDLFTAYNEGLIPDPEYEARWQEQGGNISQDNSGRNSITDPSGRGAEITLPLVIIGGLLDGINPCAISVLLILLASLSAAGSRRTIISAGISYTTAVFIFYTLAGAGILAITGFAGISVYFSVFAFVVALIAGILSIYEGVTGKQQNLIRIPESAKGILKKYIWISNDGKDPEGNKDSDDKTIKEDFSADKPANSNPALAYGQFSDELKTERSTSDEESGDEQISAESYDNRADEQISAESYENRADEQVSAGADENRADEQVSAGAYENRADEQVSAESYDNRADEQISAGAYENRADEQISAESYENRADEQVSENVNTESIIPAENTIPEISRNTKGTQNSPVRKTGCIITTAFILGTFASMFELPCTGGIYIAVLSMISSTFSESAAGPEVSGIFGIISGELSTGIIYLLIYNLMFILPLIIIIALMASGLPAGKIEKIDTFRTEKRRAIRIITGIVMIVLAVYLALGIAGVI